MHFRKRRCRVMMGKFEVLFLFSYACAQNRIYHLRIKEIFVVSGVPDLLAQWWKQLSQNHYHLTDVHAYRQR